MFNNVGAGIVDLSQQTSNYPKYNMGNWGVPELNDIEPFEVEGVDYDTEAGNATQEYIQNIAKLRDMAYKGASVGIDVKKPGSDPNHQQFAQMFWDLYNRTEQDGVLLANTKKIRTQLAELKKNPDLAPFDIPTGRLLTNDDINDMVFNYENIMKLGENTQKQWDKPQFFEPGQQLNKANDEYAKSRKLIDEHLATLAPAEQQAFIQKLASQMNTVAPFENVPSYSDKTARINANKPSGGGADPGVMQSTNKDLFVDDLINGKQGAISLSAGGSGYYGLLAKQVDTGKVDAKGEKIYEWVNPTIDYKTYPIGTKLKKADGTYYTTKGKEKWMQIKYPKSIEFVMITDSQGAVTDAIRDQIEQTIGNKYEAEVLANKITPYGSQGIKTNTKYKGGTQIINQNVNQNTVQPGPQKTYTIINPKTGAVLGTVNSKSEADKAIAKGYKVQ